LPVKLGSSTIAMPGYDIRVVDESCNEPATIDDLAVLNEIESALQYKGVGA